MEVPRKRLKESDHECAWRAASEALQIKVDAADKRIAELERLFARRSEKRAKLPPISRAPRATNEANAVRKERAATRAGKLEVVEVTSHVDSADKRCAACGDPSFRAVGTGKSSEILHYVQGHFRKHVTHRETLACRCGETLVTAAAPERWSTHTQYASSFVAYLVTQKCAASMPLYRLESMFTQLGIPVARSTMNELFHRAAATLEPLRDTLFQVLRSDALVHIDETSFKMTQQKKRSQMWCFVGDKLTGYTFDLSRSSTVPVAILGASKGTFVADDYAGYDALAKLGGRIRSGCMAHARRGFFEAGDVPEANAAMAIIQALYGVEHEAQRCEILGTAAHAALRKTHSMPMFCALMRMAHHTMQVHGPKTLLGKAARYAWTNLRELSRFLRNPALPLDNNRAENALRIVAVGRKNFLFVHSKKSGEALALLYSLTTSCARLGVNPLDYLADVLDRIEDTKVVDLRDLLPDRWKPRKTIAPRDELDSRNTSSS